MKLMDSSPTLTKAARLAVLIACHNRRDLTLGCLEKLFNARRPDDGSIDVFLVDDGSTDGTSHAVQSRFPTVTVLSGAGNLFWNGAMRVAFAAAMERGYDYYLWLNDDTAIYADSLSTAFTTCHSADNGLPAIAVGTTHDPIDGRPTYGGLRRVGRGLSHAAALVEPGGAPIECEQMTGNFVLIPSAVAAVVGNLEPLFVHNLGDIDYGMRARQAGFKLLVMPGFAGVCQKNLGTRTHMDSSLTLKERWTRVTSKKAFPPRPWLVFTRRHCGLLWPLYWIKPYFDVVALSTGLGRFRRRSDARSAEVRNG